jgi:hypothetical protein
MTSMFDCIARKIILTNDAQCLIFRPLGLNFWLGHCFKAVTLPYYLFVGSNPLKCKVIFLICFWDVHPLSILLIKANGSRFLFYFTFTLLHTYYSRFIPEGVTETSQIFLRDAQMTYIHSRLIPKGVTEASHMFLRDSVIPNDLAMNTAGVTGGKPIAVWL